VAKETVDFQAARIPLGSKVREKVTGFVGTVTGCAKYLTGCYQYAVVPKMSKKHFDGGTAPDAHWYDEGRLEVIEVDTVKPDDVAGDDPGGPCSDAPSAY